MATEPTDIVARFNALPDWSAKYRYLIDLGRTLPALPAEFQTDAHLVQGCQSKVWLGLSVDNDGALCYHAASDAAIVRGLLAVLLAVYNGKTREAVLATPLDFLQTMGLVGNLTAQRRNGLAATVKRLLQLAENTKTSSIAAGTT